MRKIIATYRGVGILLLIATLGRIPVLQADTPTTLESRQAAHTKTVSEVVSALLERQRQDMIGGDVDTRYAFKDLDVYGRLNLFLEECRQVQELNDDRFFASTLTRWWFQFKARPNIVPAHWDLLIPMMRRGWASKNLWYREAALRWAVDQQKLLTAEDLAAARKAGASVVAESKGRKGLWEMKEIGTPAEVPVIRRMYDKEFANSGEYRCLWASVESPSHGGLLALLAKMGDPKAHQEIWAAINQREDVQRRAWGIVVAANVGDKKLMPLIAKMLDDRRVVPEMIDDGPDPDRKSKNQHYTATMFTRVCDVAVRSIYAIDGKPGDWPVKKMPPSPDWGGTEGISFLFYSYREPQERHWVDSRVAVVRKWVLGFTDEQIVAVKRYATQAQVAAPKDEK